MLASPTQLKSHADHQERLGRISASADAHKVRCFKKQADERARLECSLRQLNALRWENLPPPPTDPLGEWLKMKTQMFSRPAAEDNKVEIREIQKVVCDHYGVTRMDMVSERRTADVVLPRQVAMYLARTLTTRSLPEIGRLFGGRDHTTVLHAVRKIDRLIDADPALKTAVNAMTVTLS